MEENWNKLLNPIFDSNLYYFIYLLLFMYTFQQSGHLLQFFCLVMKKQVLPYKSEAKKIKIILSNFERPVCYDEQKLS